MKRHHRRRLATVAHALAHAIDLHLPEAVASPTLTYVHHHRHGLVPAIRSPRGLIPVLAVRGDR